MIGLKAMQRAKTPTRPGSMERPEVYELATQDGVVDDLMSPEEWDRINQEEIAQLNQDRLMMVLGVDYPHASQQEIEQILDP